MATPLAFSAEHICRLTGLTMRQLGYWDRTGFFARQYADEDRRHPYSRIYSFRDLVGLRTVAVLRNRHGVPLKELKKVAAWLQKRRDAPWSSLRLSVLGRQVFLEEPDAHARIADGPLGQAGFPIETQEIADEMESEANRLRERDSEAVGKVVKRRYLHGGDPILAGTGVPTSAIWSFHEAGYDTEEIIRQYPTLTPKDVRAAIDYEERRRRRAG